MRTHTDKIYDEASFQPLKTIIDNTTLKYYMNVVKKGNQEMLRRFAFTRYRGKPRKTISKIKELWKNAGFQSLIGKDPETIDWKVLSKSIETYAPRRKKKKRHVYHGNFWKERLLARLRAKVIPSRSWAFSLRLSRDSRCRHCGEDNEDIEHLFGGKCSKLNYVGLPPEFMINAYDALDYLSSPEKVLREYFETCVVRFVKSNEVFKRGYYDKD